MSVIGIDFGDENLTVAVARRAGIDVLQNDVGKRKTRAGMSFGRVQRFIGDEFTNQYFSNATNSVVYIKRLLAKMNDDVDKEREMNYLPCELVACPNGRVNIKAKHLGKDVIVTPEQVMGTLFTKIKKVCELNMDNQKIEDCVIAVPPHFTDAQRRAVFQAAQSVAGLKPLALINETTAIALQYGLGRPIPEPRKVVFFDVGVSSTDVALVHFTQDGLKVEACCSDRHIGGRDIDEILAKYLAAQIKDKYKLDVYSNNKALLKLRRECDKIKQTLSANTKVPYNIEYLMDGKDVSGVVTRDEFNSLLDTHLKAEIVKPLQFVMNKAGITPQQIHSIELLGGSTRIPYIQTLVKDFMGKELSKTCDADEAVCRGATLMCAILSPSMKVRDYTINEVSAYGLTASWLHQPDAPSSGVIEPFKSDDKVKVLDVCGAYPCNKIVTIKETALPVTVSLDYFSTENSTDINSTSITRFIIKAPQGVSVTDKNKVKFRIKVNASGLIVPDEAQIIKEYEEEEEVPIAADPNVAPTMTDSEAPAPATEKKMVKKVSKIPLELYCYYPSSLTEDALKQAVAQEIEMANIDRLVHETAEAKNELEGYILNMRPRVSDASDLGKYFTSEAAANFTKMLKDEEEWLDDDGYDETKDVYIKRLSNLKAQGDDAVEKEKEKNLRSEAYELLIQDINKARQWANTNDEKYSHIPAEERDKVNKKCDEIMMAAKNLIDKQAATADTAPLVVRSEQLVKFRQDITSFTTNIMNKPKPKPAPAPEKKEEPKTEEKPAEEAPKAEETPKAEPMNDEEPKTEGSA